MYKTAVYYAPFDIWLAPGSEALELYNDRSKDSKSKLHAHLSSVIAKAQKLEGKGANYAALEQRGIESEKAGPGGLSELSETSFLGYGNG